MSSLAYASSHQLIRATTYAPRQIADWIDEALLTVNLPSHWEAIEKIGVTGAMDLAWYVTSPESIKALAEEIKINETLLRNIVQRLAQDAQVQDLFTLYWDHSGVQPPLPSTPLRPPGEAMSSMPTDTDPAAPKGAKADDPPPPNP